MNQYIKELKSMPTEQVKKECRDALIRTGVLDSDGNKKEQIVDCCHY